MTSGEMKRTLGNKRADPIQIPLAWGCHYEIFFGKPGGGVKGKMSLR